MSTNPPAWGRHVVVLLALFSLVSMYPLTPSSSRAVPERGNGAVGTAGSIEGTVAFSGAAPDRAMVEMATDPFCVSAHEGQAAVSEQVIVNADGTLRSAFVHIREAIGGALTAGTPATVTLNQVACRYSPRVLGVQAGATLRVTNSDQTLHNVHVQPENNPAFNVAQPIPGLSTERAFDNPEIMIPVRCDVHPWMQAFIGVVPHGHFDVTGEDGGFQLDGVPPGEYVLEAWHEVLGVQTAGVTVRDGESTAVEFTFGGGQ